MATKQATKTPVVAPIRFVLLNETKGAVRYQECNDAGEQVEQSAARIGSLYLRKDRFGEIATGDYPKRLTLTVMVG